jgi:putative Ca2+/H+ antiporter (TMEM165/GDT1 family)
MALTCNIDRRGRAIRGIAGAIAIATGAAIWVGTDATRAWPTILITLLFLITGLFTVFEATVGWCAIRAMGRKTPF